VEIDWEKTLDKLEDKLLDTRERHHDVTYNDRKATYNTEMAEKATFDDVMGEFSTDGFASDSGVNIRRVAEQVNGAIVLPGETFSLNGYTGPRGEAQGYVDAGVIQDGHADTAVGGGISQFATTLYNASYFAGMEDVAHTAHSYYISRYPAGREATVFEGAIDLQFKNTFDTPVLIQASADSSSVSVKLRGVRHVDVESIPGAKTNYTDPERIELEGDKCSASSGSRGFTTTDTRVVRDLSGREISRDTTTTKYDPSPIVTCKK
jgi:vancomycin resistance protein YoaR